MSRLMTPLLIALVLAGPAVAQQNLFFDTIDVNVVNVEVVVTDKDGQPVTALTRDDFEVFEDGKPVEITNFFAVENRQAVLEMQPDAVLDELDAPPAEPETKRLNLVVFVDDENLRTQNRNLIFDNLRQYLESELDTSDRVMLVALGDSVKVVQDFTNDREILMRNLDEMAKVVGGHSRWEAEYRQFLQDLVRTEMVAANVTFDRNRGTGGDATSAFDIAVIEAERLAIQARSLAERRYRRVRSTVDVIGRFTRSLAGMPGRKAVLYVSDGLPARPAESIAEAWRGKYEVWMLTNAGEGNMDSVERAWRDLELLNLDASRDVRELVEFASANKVTFYPISNYEAFARSHVNAEFRGSASETGQGALSTTFAATENFNLESSLLQMAEGTGGVAFTRTPNIGGLLQAIGRDFNTFYSLGFNSINSDDKEFHEIEVRLKRKDLVARHVKGHLAKDPLDHLQDLTLSALHYGLVDNPLDVRVSQGEVQPAEGKRYQVPLTIQIPFNKLLLVPENEFHAGRVSVFVVVRDEKDGGLSQPQHIELPIQVPNERIMDAITQAVGYPLTLEMKKGPKRIAIGVRDNLARVDATVELELTVGEEAS